MRLTWVADYNGKLMFEEGVRGFESEVAHQDAWRSLVRRGVDLEK